MPRKRQPVPRKVRYQPRFDPISGRPLKPPPPKRRRNRGRTQDPIRKAQLRAYKLACGCDVCGYRRSAEALHFHHRDPATKRIKPSKLHRFSEATMWAEVSRCDVLCANCHAEHHESQHDPSDTV